MTIHAQTPEPFSMSRAFTPRRLLLAVLLVALSALVLLGQLPGLRPGLVRRPGVASRRCLERALDMAAGLPRADRGAAHRGVERRRFRADLRSRPAHPVHRDQPAGADHRAVLAGQGTADHPADRLRRRRGHRVHQPRRLRDHRRAPATPGQGAPGGRHALHRRCRCPAAFAGYRPQRQQGFRRASLRRRGQAPVRRQGA